MQALPAELVRARPVLSVYYAFTLLPAELDAADARLQDAERWLQPMADILERSQAPSVEADPAAAPGTFEHSQGMVVVNEEEFRSLPGTIAIARAYCAGALGDLSGTLQYARQALDLLPAGDWFWRGAAAALAGDRGLAQRRPGSCLSRRRRWHGQHGDGKRHQRDHQFHVLAGRHQAGARPAP